jgi:hypothetical protein
MTTFARKSLPATDLAFKEEKKKQQWKRNLLKKNIVHS